MGSNSDSTNVVVLGRGRLAIEFAELVNRHPRLNLSLVVPSLPEPNWMQSLSLAAKNRGWNLATNGNLAQLLQEGSTYLGVSISYDHILKPSEILLFERIVNLHNSPLPRYRGANPINWALLNRERFHGVTLHEIDEGIDTGPILAQVRFGIDPEVDEVIDVYRKCVRWGRILLFEFIQSLGEAVPYIPSEQGEHFHVRSESALLGDRLQFCRQELKNASPGEF